MVDFFAIWKGVKKIICATFCTKLWKQNNDSQNPTKSYLFLMHTNYIFIHILLFYKAWYFKHTRRPNSFIVGLLLIHCYLKGNVLESIQCAFEYYLMYILYFQRCFKFYSIFCSCRALFRNFDLINLQGNGIAINSTFCNLKG